MVGYHHKESQNNLHGLHMSNSRKSYSETEDHRLRAQADSSFYIDAEGSEIDLLAHPSFQDTHDGRLADMIRTREVTHPFC